MRGRVFFLLSSLLLSTPAVPQCTYRFEYSAPLRTTYFDAAIDGNDLWAATGYGVQLFDRSADPPRLVATMPIPEITGAIDARNGIAYAGSGASIYVLRRNGPAIEIVRSFEAAGTVNDLAAAASSLFAATTTGLTRIDLAAGVTPVAAVTLPTSSANVLSVALAGNDVFAADGDASVERFTSGSSTPAAINALSRSTSVSVAGDRLFVSDGQQTLTMTGAGVPVATIPFGALNVAGRGENTFFIAGSDRRYRAIDLTVAGQPVELFAAEIIPSGGTVNRIGAIVAAAGRIYVAGGDAGLVVLDASAFAPPFPLRSHPFGAKTSSADGTDSVFVSNGSGGITRLQRFSSGRLDEAGTWAVEQQHLVHDFSNGFLLTSSGPILTWWSVAGTNATAVSQATLAGPVRAAVVAGNTAFVLLDDRSLWTADLAQQTPAPVRSTLAAASFLARSGNVLATAEVTTAGETVIRFYPSPASEPASVTVPGAATAFSFGGTRAATFTFRGISVTDFSGPQPATTLLPQSNTALVLDLAVIGDGLLDLTSNAVRVWDLSSGRLVRSFALPSPGLSLSVHPAATSATVLTGDGVVHLDFDSPTPQPVVRATFGGNQYATKIAATSKSLFVFEGSSIDVYDAGRGGAPRFARTIPTPGAIDLAASETHLFVLFSNGSISSFTHGGTLLRTAAIDEGTDALARAIFAPHGVPWISISRGCLSTGCEEKTLIYDPQSLVRTAAMEGGVRDVAVAGNAAWARVDLLPEVHIRAYDLSDPLHPAVTATRPAEGGAVAIAATGAELVSLGSRLFTYAPSSLTKIGEELETVAVNAATGAAADGSCLVLTGRSAAAEIYTRSGNNWTRSAAMPLPGTARRMAVDGGRVYVLTDYSIEVWSRTGPQPNPARRRAAR
jgi:hypothetical protein